MARRPLRTRQEAPAPAEPPKGAGKGKPPSERRLVEVETRVSTTGVTFHPVENRKLVTYDAEDDVWDHGQQGKFPPKGSIVRLRPPVMPEKVLRMVRDAFVAEGAAAVRVQQARKKDTLPREKQSHVQPRARAREAAMALVAEAVTGDREALHRAVEEALVAGGL